MAENDTDLLAYTSEKEPILYEVGYHLLSTIPEDRVAEESGKIKDAIEAREGVFVTEGLPKMTSLAYKIPKVIANKRKYFDTAFFGWMRFHMSPHEIVVFRDELKRNEHILRFIVIKAAKEEKAIPLKKLAFIPGALPPQTAYSKDTPEEKKEGRLSEEELDKT